MPELMDRLHFHSLSQPLRDEWVQRLMDQWNIDIHETQSFEFDGDRITAVVVYKRDSEGKRYGAVEVLTATP